MLEEAQRCAAAAAVLAFAAIWIAAGAVAAISSFAAATLAYGAVAYLQRRGGLGAFGAHAARSRSALARRQGLRREFERRRPGAEAQSSGRRVAPPAGRAERELSSSAGHRYGW